jgi:hypothetical protein
MHDERIARLQCAIKRNTKRKNAIENGWISMPKIEYRKWYGPDPNILLGHKIEETEGEPHGEIIEVDSEFGKLINFNNSQFLPSSWLYKDERNKIIYISMIEAKKLCYGAFRSLLKGIFEMKYQIKVPNPMGVMPFILQKYGFNSEPCNIEDVDLFSLNFDEFEKDILGAGITGMKNDEVRIWVIASNRKKLLEIYWNIKEWNIDSVRKTLKEKLAEMDLSRVYPKGYKLILFPQNQHFGDAFLSWVQSIHYKEDEKLNKELKKEKER